MPWPPFLKRAFDVQHPADESRWYGPYNMLLVTLFPADQGFMVSPQFSPYVFPHTGGGLSVNFVVVLLVFQHEVPMFFVEIKPPQHLANMSIREAADAQMRERFRSLTENINTPKLYGISVMGPRFCLYTFDATTSGITPLAIPRATDIVNDVAPKARWDHDILSDDGEVVLRGVVEEVKSMAADLLDKVD
ncbi:hypothetical protein GLOTRDRAFT_50022 [Gloeophyllum trabeum ATCC 11539]|uniref:Fungal-type protein kinase domain-containing protein n=1 Tax=Gloeophyllum trabeum (strain ATCC 11539 / FP-39264 / Madison 617) TaxID=670483 RepID=S7PTY6_GLOTA|nr:uncharacterized protein GLOTRDRAFT_50022 [Gloeophyllum trabeum ATCC 11539]EPQ50802.1 hypothetical protein GLOTRDRAFT_50022 [Gloeophyllum trabeum ATCC 11539]